MEVKKTETKVKKPIMSYFYDSGNETCNIVEHFGDYQKNSEEVELTKLQFESKKQFDTPVIEDKKFLKWEENLELKTKILFPQKKAECRELILSKYSESDQANIKSQVLYEREILGAVTEETKQTGKIMFEWITAVLTELRTNGINADFSSFK